MTNLQDTESAGKLNRMDFMPAGYPSLPSCANGPCRQGRFSCPTPEACQLPTADSGDFGPIRGLLVALAITASIIGVVALVSIAI